MTVEIPTVQDLGGVFLLDTRHMGYQGTTGVFLVPGDGGFALVETGPGSTLEQIKSGITEAGFDLKNLQHILVTHIHLDHAGAAGALAEASGARVYVHEKGAPHLIDPSRLMSSATRIYGDKMDELWGEMRPTPEAQVEVLSGGEKLELLGHAMQVIYTPGHASHHVAYLLDGDTMFTGDAAAIRLTGSKVIRPALPPPEIDLEIWRESVARMSEAKPKRLMLTHFGEVKDAAAHLGVVAERNQTWADEILKGLQADEETEALVERISDLGNAELRADEAPPEVLARHQVTSNYEMTVTGVVRYWKKHHPERLES